MYILGVTSTSNHLPASYSHSKRYSQDSNFVSLIKIVNISIKWATVLSTSSPPISCCCSSSSKNISSSSRSSSLDSNHTWPATGLLSSFIFLYIFSLFLNGVLYDRRAGGSFSGRSFLFCLFFFSPSLCYFFSSLPLHGHIHPFFFFL